MTITALVERPKRSNGELLEIFADCKRRYGDDLGLMFMAMHLESEDRIVSWS
jgi:hypothetical protein